MRYLPILTLRCCLLSAQMHSQLDGALSNGAVSLVIGYALETAKSLLMDLVGLEDAEAVRRPRRLIQLKEKVHGSICAHFSRYLITWQLSESGLLH
jgi:hypothetical protein